MPLNLNDTDLNILGLTMDAVRDLSEQEQANTIKRSWKLLCLQYHPDKVLGQQDNGARFILINAAYTRITTPQGQDSHQRYNRHSINTYFNLIPEMAIIPETAFDMFMEEGISAALDAILRAFRESTSEENKRRLANENATFITLAQAVNNRAEVINRLRVSHLSEQENEPLNKTLRRYWRMLVIRLFAEEYLDDFQYRHAMAFGELMPILATRKLMSPLKWLALATGGIECLFSTPAEYALKHEQGLLSSLLFLLAAPFSFINYPIICMASPINHGIRPLAAYTQISPVALTILCLGAVATLTFMLMTSNVTFSLAAAMSLIPYINIALNLYSIYPAIQLIQKIRESIDPTLPAVWLGVSILLGFFSSGFPLYDLMFSVSTLMLIQVCRNMLQERPIETLPLPVDVVPEEIKQAALLGYKTATQSHRFFGTPKNAHFHNQRTAWQKAAALFGADIFDAANVTSQTGYAPRVLALAYNN